MKRLERVLANITTKQMEVFRAPLNSEGYFEVSPNNMHILYASHTKNLPMLLEILVNSLPAFCKCGKCFDEKKINEILDRYK